MPALNDLTSLPLFSNSPIQWLIACAVGAGMMMLLLTSRRVVRSYHKRLRETERQELLEIPLQVLSRTTLPFFVVLSLFLALRTLTTSPQLDRAINSAITIALFWQTGVWAVAAVSAWLERKKRAALASDRAMVGSLGIIGFIGTVIIWAMVALLTLDNLGINITALVAGLGIGGIAVALAVQNILGDLFASLSIALDRPFVVGDFLIIDDFLGSVEHIGIKSTRLRSLSGEQIVMSNADLLKSRVRNYGRMAERRVVFANSVSLETPIESVERIPALIRDIVESQPNTRFDRSHFAKYGAGSMDFETVYYVLSPDYNKYMDTQQAINVRIHREFAKLGVKFGYPAQKLFIAQAEDAERRVA